MSAAPRIMGIVNASPESFSDGSAVGDLDAQVAHGLRLRDEGAAIVDVGGESGVTDRAPVSEDEEIARVVPLVERLSGEGVEVSVDTWKPAVAREALAAGATMVNDVSGLADPALADVCAEAGAGLVVTHTAAPPKEKEFPGYGDVGEEVVEFLRERIDLAAARGVERIVLDPGPDLAKTPAETVAVLRALPRVAALGREVLLAVSRKDFVGAITRRAPGDRLAGTLAAIGVGLDAGASIVRAHDVAAVADYLAVRAALRGEREVPPELRLDPELRRGVWHALPRT